MTTLRFLVLAVLAVAVSLATAQAEAQPAPLEDDFQINTLGVTSGEALKLPSATMMPDGSFVVVWTYETYFYVSYVRGQRFQSDGSPIGGELAISGYETHYQLYPGVAGAGDGSFLVVWEAFDQTRARYYDSSGQPTGPPYPVTSDTLSNPALDGPSPFVVVWDAYGDGSSHGIWARLLDSGGIPTGSQFQVNVDTYLAQRFADVAVARNGSFVVTWKGGLLGSGSRARWFDSSGVPLTSEQLLDPSAPDAYTSVGVADEEDRFLIVWDEAGTDGDLSGIRARLWDEAGQPVGSAFDVNSSTAGTQAVPRVAAAREGTFLVVWNNHEIGGHVGRLVSRQGDLVGDEFIVNSNTAGSQSDHVVAGGTDTFVVSWRDMEADEDFDTIEGRRFKLPSIFADGFETGDTSSWSTTVFAPIP